MKQKNRADHQRLAVHRIHIISGQVNKLVQMVEDEAYCVDSLTQSLAIQKALASLNKLLLGHHIASCVVDQIKKGKEEQAISELMQLYHLENK